MCGWHPSIEHNSRSGPRNFISGLEFDRSFYCGAACYSEEAQTICFRTFRTDSRISQAPTSRKIAIFGTSISRFVGAAQSSYRDHVDQRSISGFQCSIFENAKIATKMCFVVGLSVSKVRCIQDAILGDNFCEENSIRDGTRAPGFTVGAAEPSMRVLPRGDNG